MKIFFSILGASFLLLFVFHLVTIDKLFFAKIAQGIPFVLKIEMTLFLSLLFVVEYMPVVFFVSLFLFGRYLDDINVLDFYKLKGVDYKKKLFRHTFITLAVAAAFFSLLLNVIIPLSFRVQQKDLHRKIINEVLHDPSKFIEPGEMTEIENFIFHVDEIAPTERGFSAKNINIFHRFYLLEEPILSQITRCDQVDLDPAQEMAHFLGCEKVKIFRNNMEPRIKAGSASFADLEREAIELMRSTMFDITVPGYLRYFTVSIQGLIKDLFNEYCPPSQMLYALRRVFYFLSFFIYSMAGLVAGFSFKKNTLFILSFYGAILPHLYLYLGLADKGRFGVLEAPYAFPVIFSAILFFQIYKKKKRGKP